MKDPYSVLGVGRNASDVEIKKAYRDLARKYHPDNYHDNPLADLAQEKMKEINEAYDTVTRERASGSSGAYTNAQYDNNGYAGGSSYNYTGYGSASFAQVRAALNNNDAASALHMLEVMSVRNAEWNYLMGRVRYMMGWYDEARRYFSTAVSMEPSNVEYRNALNTMSAQNAYRPVNYTRNQGGVDLCDVCTALMCLNMCCR